MGQPGYETSTEKVRRCTWEQQPPEQKRSLVQLLLWTVMFVLLVLLFVRFMQDNHQRILQQNANDVAGGARQRAAEVDRVLSEASEQIETLA